MDVKKTIARSVDVAYRLALAVQTHDPSALEPRQQKAFWAVSQIAIPLSLLVVLLDPPPEDRIKHGWF